MVVAGKSRGIYRMPRRWNNNNNGHIASNNDENYNDNQDYWDWLERDWLEQHRRGHENPITNEGFMNVPEGSINTITLNTIKDGNTLINFRGNKENSFESKFGRYYKESTAGQLNRHPSTRGDMLNKRRYTASIIPTLKNNNTGYNANTEGGTRKRRKSRRATRKGRKGRRATRK